MEKLVQDLRFGARMLRKNPGMTAIAVLALSLGIGLTTTVFSITYGALYRGLPLPDADRVMHLERNNLERGINSMEVTVHDFRDWRAQQTAFEDIAGFYSGTVNLSGLEGRPERFSGAFMTANALDVTGVRPLLGRSFRESEDDPGAPGVVVIGYSLWTNRFEGDRDVIGQTVRINGEPAEIIGVMPEGFLFPFSQNIWVPMKQDVSALARGEGTTVEVFGRLKPGVSMDQGAVEMNTIARRLAMEYPETNENVGAVVQPYTKEFIGDEPQALLLTMLGAVFFVLLIACANVANLLLSRATVRSKEVAIRSAIGASRWRVVRQMLGETMVIAAVGGVMGLAIAAVGIRLFNAAIVDTEPPYWIDIRIDPIALAFVVGLILLTTIIAGIIPALKASGQNVHEILKDETRGSSSMRLGRITKGLVVAEVALSCGLLVAAGLTIKSVVQLKNLDYGFDAGQIFTARIGLFESQYPDSLARLQFYDEAVERLAALPGARHVAAATGLPAVSGGGTDFAIEGAEYLEPQDYPDARMSVVSTGFFDVFGVGPREGRVFDSSDDGVNLPVAAVNESFAQRFFAGESPLGRRIRIGGANSTRPWRTIVGVVPDLWMAGIDNEEPWGFYIPLKQGDARFISIAVATGGDAMSLASPVRDAIQRIDADLPLYWVQTLEQGVDGNTWFYRVFGTLFMIFGFVALFLASVGLYGVMSFAVSRRTQEIGVRMALGAKARDVLRLMLRQGLVQLGLGVTLGLALAALLSRFLQIILFDVNPRDPVIFVGIVMLLAAVGLLANVVPAKRAARVDPMVALRYE
jgi:putative ABC transport system permease protein